MSTMKFREPNQVLWRGFRPGHNGTQIIKSVSAGPATTLHTVSAGKTFYLTTLIASEYASFGRFRIYVRDTTPLTQYYFLDVESYTKEGAGFSISIPFNPPVEIPSGWIFVVKRESGVGQISCCIHGWEE